jgi:hypothetical protein
VLWAAAASCSWWRPRGGSALGRLGRPSALGLSAAVHRYCRGGGLGPGAAAWFGIAAAVAAAWSLGGRLQTPGCPAALNRDQRRALRLLATAPNGATEAIMLAHGFEHALLDDLVLRGLATAEKRAMRAGRRPIRVTWLTITDAGRQALG